MKFKFNPDLRILSLLAALISVPTKADDAKTVGHVVQNFWWAQKKLDWNGMASRVEFPFAFNQIGFDYAGRLHIIRTRKQFEREFMDIKKDIRSGLYYEVPKQNQRIYNIQSKLTNKVSALVTYTYQPGGEKYPFTLVTHLRKTKRGWKIVFSNIPWFNIGFDRRN